MNSVKLANIVWKKVRQYSIFPSDDLLRDVVYKESPESPEHVKENAFIRILERSNALKNLQEQLKKVDPQSKEGQEILDKIGRLSISPIREGEIKNGNA